MTTVTEPVNSLKYNPAAPVRAWLQTARHFVRSGVNATAFFLIFLLVSASPAQVPAVPSPTLAQPLQWSFLNKALRHAGQIFSGTVLQVEHRSANSSSTLATTGIHLRVDEAIRGVRKGQVLEIKEWAGLWQAGERYRTGQRVLLFLYPPSKLGLTSPVGGQFGRFLIDSNGNVLFGGKPGSAPRPVQIHRMLSAIRRAEIKQ